MDSASSSVEENYRKNLMIVASIISIYSIAGGGFDSELAIAGAKLKFSNPQYLEYASIVVLLFLWWRHWLVSYADRESFNLALASRAVVPKEIYKKANEVLKVKEIESQVVSGNGFLQSDYCINDLSMDFIGLLKVSYQLKYTRGGVGGNEPEEIALLLVSAPIVFLRINCNYRKEWIKLVLFDTRFGDAIFPSVMTFIAFVSYSYNFLSR